MRLAASLAVRKSTLTIASCRSFTPSALALAGRAEDATSSVRRGLELEPGFRIRVFFEFGMARPLAEKFVEGARVLGLPE
jgi:hypothetical protein